MRFVEKSERREAFGAERFDAKMQQARAHAPHGFVY
jgi:hypothetical protein